MDKNLEQVRTDWARRGFSCELWTDPPGQVWEGFTHSVEELLMLLEGEVELEVQGRKRLLEPGKEEAIPAHALHSVRNLGKTASRWLYGYRKK